MKNNQLNPALQAKENMENNQLNPALQASFDNLQLMLMNKLTTLASQKHLLTTEQNDLLVNLSAKIYKYNEKKPENDNELILGLSQNLIYFKDITHIINFERSLMSDQNDQKTI